MPTDTDAVAAEISSRWPRRRSPKFYCVIAVLVAGMATWIVLSLVDRRYGPIEPGFFAAPYSRANAGFTKTGTEYIKGRPGSEVSRYYGLENHGSHDVVVTSVDPIAPPVRVQWSDYVVRPGGDETGERRPWRDFPATIPAHGTIRPGHHPKAATMRPWRAVPGDGERALELAARR